MIQNNMQSRHASIAASHTVCSPLYRRIKALVEVNIRNDVVCHSVFDGIRNRGELKRILIKMNFIPDSQYVIKKWTKVSDKAMRKIALKNAREYRLLREHEAELKRLETSTEKEKLAALQVKLLKPRVNTSAAVRAKIASGKALRTDCLGSDIDKSFFFNAMYDLQRKGFKFEQKTDAQGATTYRLLGDDIDFDAKMQKMHLTEAIKAEFRAGRTVMINNYPSANSVKNSVYRLKQLGLVVESIKVKGVVVAFRLKDI